MPEDDPKIMSQDLFGDADDMSEPSLSEAFCVTDDASANWVVKRITAAREYADRVVAWAEREKRRARREEQFFLTRFGSELEKWATKQIAAAGGRRKSISLPAGTLGFRFVSPKTVIEDETAVIEWAKLHCPDAIRVVDELSKTVLDKHLEETSQVLPPGVRVEPATERFYVR